MALNLMRAWGTQKSDAEQILGILATDRAGRARHSYEWQQRKIGGIASDDDKAIALIDDLLEQRTRASIFSISNVVFARKEAGSLEPMKHALKGLYGTAAQNEDKEYAASFEASYIPQWNIYPWNDPVTEDTREIAQLSVRALESIGSDKAIESLEMLRDNARVYRMRIFSPERGLKKPYGEVKDTADYYETLVLSAQSAINNVVAKRGLQPKQVLAEFPEAQPLLI